MKRQPPFANPRTPAEWDAVADFHRSEAARHDRTAKRLMWAALACWSVVLFAQIMKFAT